MLLHRSTCNLAALSFTGVCNNDKVLQGHPSLAYVYAYETYVVG